jgi:cytochrome c2
MRWIGLAGSLVLGFVFASDLSFPTATFAQDPLAGSHVFGTRGCATCHAVGGIGGKIGPDLKAASHARSFYDLAAAMWNHLPKMADQLHRMQIRRPRMDTREADNLTAFLATIDFFDPPGNPAVGKKLFVEKRCVLCHQAGGTGGVVGPDLDQLAQGSSPISIAAALWNHGPSMSAAMRARGIERPSFTGTELQDLMAYLKSYSRDRAQEPIYVLPGRADEGQRLFFQKKCNQCHGSRGEGGPWAPRLYNRKAPLSLLQFSAAMWNKAPAMLRVMKDAEVTPPQLTAEDMANIVAYLYSVNYFADLGDAARGKELMTTKGCVECHTVGTARGKGVAGRNPIGRLERPSAFVSALWNHLAVIGEAEQKKIQWPQLTAQQAADLVAFLQTAQEGRD